MKNKFKSKRNEVYLTDENIIQKVFSEKESFDNEIKYLELLAKFDVAVPKIISQNEKALNLEFIEGELLIDTFARLENEKSSPNFLIDELLNWLNSFYKITKETFGSQHIILDINFRNFIFKEEKIYGIDFEQCTMGEMETDIGRISAFAIMYDPIKTEWKMKFAKDFTQKAIDKFDLNEEKINQVFQKELQDMEIRRSKYKK